MEPPQGGIDARKYAAVALALGMARGALYSALDGDLDGAGDILNLTGTANIAQALGCSESELAIDCNEHLTYEEILGIQFGPIPKAASKKKGATKAQRTSRPEVGEEEGWQMPAQRLSDLPGAAGESGPRLGAKL